MEQNKVLKKTFCSVFSPSLLRKFWEKSSFYKRANSLSQRAPLILYSPQSQPTPSPLQNVQIWKRQGCWQHKKTAILRQLFQHWWNKEFSETFSWDSMKILKTMRKNAIADIMTMTIMIANVLRIWVPTLSVECLAIEARFIFLPFAQPDGKSGVGELEFGLFRV